MSTFPKNAPADKTTPNVTLIDKAHKKYGYQWSGDPATIASQAKLDLIASEESKGGQSATCIQSANNKLYVSYHTYGDKNFGGNIEVLSMTGNQLKVDANKAAENCDYNHLIVDGNSLYLAGSGKKSAGAFLGKVDINDGKLGDEVKLYAIDNKTKMDANCVAEFNGEHVVATTKGLTSFAKDFSFWSKAGAEGKHVVTANNKLYTLDVDGNVNVYDNNELETPVTYKVGAVVPKDNKAVMAVEEILLSVYICTIFYLEVDGTDRTIDEYVSTRTECDILCRSDRFVLFSRSSLFDSSKTCNQVLASIALLISKVSIKVTKNKRLKYVKTS
jgi:hypothetical protein